MVWLVIGVAVLLIVVVSRWAFRREAQYRVCTGETRPERHDPGQDYVIRHANGGGG